MSKQLAVYEFLREKNVHIAFLQETNLEVKNEYKLNSLWENSSFILNGGPNQSGNGVAVVSLVPDIKISHAASDCQGKILAVDIEVHGEKFRGINVHFPNRDGGSCKEQRDFIDSLDFYMQTRNPIIVGGDFNFVETPEKDRFPVPKINGDKATAKHWAKFCTDYEIKEKAFSSFTGRKFYTWRMGKFNARLDRFYGDKNIKFRASEKYDFAASDHDLVVNEIDISQGKSKGKGLWKCNNKVFGMEGFKTDLALLIAKGMTEKDFVTHPDTWWIKMKGSIKTLCIKYSKVLKEKENEEKSKLENDVAKYKNDLENTRNGKKYYEAKKKLNDFLIRNMKEKLNKQKYKNFGNNYFTTKEFFRQFRKKRRENLIEKLKNVNGESKTETNDLLGIAHAFYSDLYKKRDTDKTMQQFFIDKIQNRLSTANLDSLNMQITETELQAAVLKTKENKSPGIDGLSANLYKNCFDILGKPLTKVLNHCFTHGKVPYSMKIGILTLLYKKGDPELMKNYRPVSLQNNDVKLLTKIICTRLKPIMSSLITQHQYANTSKNISTAISLLRDLQSCVKKRSIEHYFLSIDFVKAYDSIDREYLFKVLEKYGFQGNILAFIKDLYTGSTAKIVLNGFISKTIKMRRGIKQGDALSLYLFMFSIDPLLLATEQNTSIEGVKTPGRFHIKNVSYADDVNLCLKGKSSVINAYSVVTNFGLSTGLKPQPLNTPKASTLFLINTSDISGLPEFCFTTEGYETLGSAIGSESYIENFWMTTYKNKIEPEIDFLCKFNLTLDAKSVLSKSKILPKVSYNSGFYEVPLVIRRKIESKLTKFSQGNGGKLKTYEKMCCDKKHGGYDICHVVKHAELALLKPIFKLIKYKKNRTPFTVDIALTEAEVGLKMSNINQELNLDPIRNIHHHAVTSSHYKSALEIIRYYKISGEEILNGKLKNIYSRIQNGTSRTKYQGVANSDFQIFPPLYTSLHHDILPNYLKTFIYRMSNCLLPLKCNYTTFGLDTDSRCEFCNINYETNFHVFFECKRIYDLWKHIEYLTNLKLYSNNIINFKHSESEADFNMNVYCTALVCHKIWKHRNDLRHGSIQSYDENVIINAFKKSFISRNTFETHREASVYLSEFQRIVSRILSC